MKKANNSNSFRGKRNSSPSNLAIYVEVLIPRSPKLIDVPFELI